MAIGVTNGSNGKIVNIYSVCYFIEIIFDISKLINNVNECHKKGWFGL